LRLRRELEDRGLVLLAARPAAGLTIPGLGLPVLAMPSRRRLPQRDFLVFNQELATLLKAGMPLVQSLDILRQRVQHPTFKQVLDDVHDQVRGGTSLSDAFASHGDLVPTKDVPMAWPNSVEADDEFIYVSDMHNARLMRLAKTFAASETVALQ
jgi:type II secretory pathway component PulF